eukprot:TRINITY_DN83210_c0_g1_i1.p1 TRINITY_DN83210_c0_g1~~TRINITY_DN83210_c0_g1_i1.p1  ORF type:complete len:461 (+),score=58.96 TRINITY_DN83210_c0_g1_i1:82-1464(+)
MVVHLALVLVLCLCLVSIGCAESESHLRTRLLKEYHRDVLPNRTVDPIGPTTVELGINFVWLQHMSQLDGTFGVNAWLRYHWVDPRLTWNVTQDADGRCVQKKAEDSPCVLTLTQEEIWIPDIVLYNAVHESLEELHETQLTVLPAGDVKWSRPGIARGTCKFDLSRFPDDEQHCFLELGSWSHHAGDLALAVNNVYNAVDVDEKTFIDSEEWAITPTHVEVVSAYYGCCPDPFESVKFHLVCKRHSNYYYMVIVYPASSLAVAILFSVFIPHNSGEKIGFVTTMVLTLTVYLMIVVMDLPKSYQSSMVTTVMISLLYGSLSYLGCTIIYVKITHMFERQKHKEDQDEHKELMSSTLSAIRTSIHRNSELEVLPAVTCVCGNKFMDDANYCRKCGVPRPGLTEPNFETMSSEPGLVAAPRTETDLEHLPVNQCDEMPCCPKSKDTGMSQPRQRDVVGNSE